MFVGAYRIEDFPPRWGVLNGIPMITSRSGAAQIEIMHSEVPICEIQVGREPFELKFLTPRWGVVNGISMIT